MENVNQCAVCEHSGNVCDPLECIFRSYFTGSQGREDYSRCLALYGDDVADMITDINLTHRRTTLIECMLLRSWRIFDQRRRQGYDHILMNLTRYSFLTDRPQDPPDHFLPCMVCIHRRVFPHPKCIFNQFFPYGRQAESDYEFCRQKYGRNVAKILCRIPRNELRNTIMFLIASTRTFEDGTCYADDPHFLSHMYQTYDWFQGFATLTAIQNQNRPSLFTQIWTAFKSWLSLYL